MSRARDTAGGSGQSAGSTETTTPKAAVGRLSLYLRQLESLLLTGQKTVSSSQLGAVLGITDAQVRKDLAYFGQFGCPGIGYYVAELRDALRAVLGTDRTWRTALIGIGNLGRALLNYRGFRERGFEICALFDSDDRLVGEKINDKEVERLGDLAQRQPELSLELAILAVPGSAAQDVAEMIVKAGIVGILNFAPVQLKVPEDVSVVSVDLGLQFEQLAYLVRQRISPLGTISDVGQEAG